MRLSIIIVNYNVKFFLEQCLHSVQKAISNIDAEVYVVDNNSVDKSVSMVADKFPWVKLLANTKNTGFAVANNQAIKLSSGDYVLLLNPDTVVEEDTFEKCIAFMDRTPNAGGLGVKMVDGKGQFLPESKRGLPTPSVAFYKIFGLSQLFPNSKRFGAYHQGHLSNDETNPVDVLAGAFMLMRKKALDDVGLLDEAFFMYGEDIDLSYRLTKGGYTNYYYPEARIIHYKGESTKKGSLNYVFIFYKAMVIFAKKHFSSKNAKLFSTLIHVAIYLRASLSLARRFINKIWLPSVDIALTFGGLLYLKNYWEINHRYIEGGSYPDVYTEIVIPCYITVWMIMHVLCGVYDKPFKLKKLTISSLYGLITLLSLYALLPDEWRFSRAIILLGSVWAGISILITRTLFKILKFKDFQYGEEQNKRFLIIGSESEFVRVKSLLNQTQIKSSFMGHINNSDNYNSSTDCIGSLAQLDEAISIYQIDELIFCSKDMSAQSIISYMSLIERFNLDFKIAPEESMYVIGSNSINTQGELYAFELHAINTPENSRNKRLFDFVSSLVILCSFPIFMLLNMSFIGLFKNCMLVLLGRKTWISYKTHPDNINLPKIKKGVLSPVSHLSVKLKAADIFRLNMLYAKGYKLTNDFELLLKNMHRLS